MTSARDAKLIWNCRRGMLELDIILSKFVSTTFRELNAAQRDTLERLLTYPDPVLYAYLMREDVPDDKELMGIVNLIRADHTA
jgi:antitoxin CptB